MSKKQQSRPVSTHRNDRRRRSKANLRQKMSELLSLRERVAQLNSLCRSSASIKGRQRATSADDGPLARSLETKARAERRKLSSILRPPAVARLRQGPGSLLHRNGLFCLSVPELTRSGGIQLNRRPSLRRQFHALSSSHRYFSPSELTTATPSGSMIGTIVKFSVSLAAVAASLFAISWIGLALLGF